MLHLPRGRAFRVDVRELLELQRALECGRVVHTAAQEQEVPRGVVTVCERAHLRLLAEDGVDERRKMEGLGEQPPRALLIDRAAALSEIDREEVQVNKHRGIGLGRRNRDLGTCMEIDHVVRHAARLAPHDVDESEQACASFPGFLHRGERVRRLAGLGDREEELSLGDDRLAVPVLTWDVDIAGDTGKALDQDLPHECRMTRRAAAHQGYP